MADFYAKCLKLPSPNPAIHANPTVQERWIHAETLWQYCHAAQVFQPSTLIQDCCMTIPNTVMRHWYFNPQTYGYPAQDLVYHQINPKPQTLNLKP